MPRFAQFEIIDARNLQIDTPFRNDDCACVEDGRVLITSAGFASQYVPIPHYMASIDERFNLLLPHSTSASPALLNKATSSLVLSYRQLQVATESNQLYDLLGIKQAVDYLVHIGLLQPVDAITSLQVADTLTAWLHVTNECNLRCHYCYVAKTPEHMSAETGKQAINAIFRSAKQYNMRSVHLKYAGGEAAINFNRIRALHRQALNLAEEYGIALQATVLSNGVGWSERKIEYLKQQALNLTISLDGIGTDHDIQRPMRNGRGSFAAIERTLNRLATHSVIPNISITISSRNIAGLPKPWIICSSVTCLLHSTSIVKLIYRRHTAICYIRMSKLLSASKQR